MRKTFRVFLLVSLASVFAISIIGCLIPGPGKYTGGGWLPSAEDPDAKATFGFNVHLDDKDGDGSIDGVKGQIQYNDKAAGVKAHGVVTGGNADTGSLWGDLNGGGFFLAIVFDAGELGVLAEDSFSILLVDADLVPTYENIGLIGGGNIQKHK